MNRFVCLAVAAVAAAPLFAQSPALVCQTTANPPIVRAEGLAERVGDIVLNCTGGTPGATVTTNLTVFLSVNVTNHVSAAGVVDALLTVDNAPDGATPNSAPANVPPTLVSVASIAWQGLSFTLSPEGSATLRISNVRGNATQAAGSLVLAYLALNGTTSVPVSNSQFTVAIPQTSAYASFGAAAVCDQNGSPAPETPSIPNFLAAGTLRAGARLTEGFASAFAPKSDWSNLDADTGVRIIMRYSGLPGVARLFVPVLVAGSSADAPTAAGDLGTPAAAGRYTPGAGQLLLALVNGADANGAGGTLAASVPAAQTDLADAAEAPLTDGAGYVVYEVVDANPSARESVQIPSFVTAPPIYNGGTYTSAQTVALAPVSQVATAVAGAPVPRFNGAAPASDCSILGDCTALYFPRLAVETDPIVVNTTTDNPVTRYFMVRNAGSGILQWSTAVTYTNGSGWLRVAPDSSTGNGALVYDILPANLAPGSYQANIVISGGDAGTITVPVTLNLGAPVPPTPVIAAVTSAAESRLSAAPGSLATIYGSNLAGSSVAVAFDGQPADVLFSNATQINFRVPDGVAQNARVVATVNGIASAPFAAKLALIAPAIFAGAVVNEDGTPNNETNPAKPGTTVVLYGTGAASAASVNARVHDVDVLSPAYGGAAPTLPGVQQVNVVVPEGLPSMQTFVYMCASATSGSERVCSPARKIWLQR